jgi:hypothetical protein
MLSYETDLPCRLLDLTPLLHDRPDTGVPISGGLTRRYRYRSPKLKCLESQIDFMAFLINMPETLPVPGTRGGRLARIFLVA